MGVRLLGRAMLGQTVVAAIIYGFVRTVLTCKLSEHIYAPDLGLKLHSLVISDRSEAYLAKWSHPFSQVKSRNGVEGVEPMSSQFRPKSHECSLPH